MPPSLNEPGQGAGEEPAPPAGPRRPSRSRWARAWRLGLAVVLCGAAAGLIGIAAGLLLEAFEHLFYGVADGSLPLRVAAAPAWRRVLAPAAGGAMAGALWWWERATGGVIGVGAAVMDPSGERARRMGLLRPFGDAILQILTVGAGNSVGREGAPRLAAAAVAAKAARWLGIDGEWRGVLIASAAGAGLGAMYNAPLAGAAYAVEVVLAHRGRWRQALVAVPLSCLAVVVSWLRSHGAASLPMPVSPASWASLVGVLVVVPVAAGAGVAARALWKRFQARKASEHRLLPLAIGGAGLLTGAASLAIAVIPGNGKDAFQAALDSPATAAALLPLLGVIVLKPLLTGATLGAGATGGLLAPSFSLGGCVGAAIGIGLAAAGLPVSVAALALAGAGVTLALTQRAPVFAAVFVWEDTHGPVWMLPVLLVACWAAQRLIDRPRRG